jgi:hypothetical protein
LGSGGGGGAVGGCQRQGSGGTSSLPIPDQYVVAIQGMVAEMPGVKPGKVVAKFSDGSAI